MKLVWHLLRKELRLSRVFVVPVMMLQLLRLASLLGWFGPPAPTEQGDGWLNAFVITIAGGALVGFILVLFLQVLANDSPVREETFVSTRPVCRWQLVVSKFLNLVIWVVVPFGLVELIHLWSLGWTFGRVALGVLQMVLVVTAVVALVMALGWMWRSKREGWIAYVAGFVVIAGSLALCALFTEFYWDEGTRNATQFTLTKAFSMSRILGALFVAVVVSWALLVMQWRRTWSFGRRLVSACLMLALIMVGMWFAPSRGVEVIEMEAPLVMSASLLSSTKDADNELVQARFLPGVESLVEDYEVKWVARSVAIDGKDLRLPPLVSPQIHPDWWVSWWDRDFAIRAAVKEVVGDDQFLMVDSEIHSRRPSAQIRIPSDWISGEETELAVELVRQRFEWKLLAELPLKTGAIDSPWKVEGVLKPKGGLLRLEVSLGERTSHFWMAGEENIENRKSLRFMLVDDESGMCRLSEGFVSQRTIGSFSAAPWHGYRLEFTMQGDDEFAVNLERVRLLVFQSEWHDSRSLKWKGKLELKEVSISPGLAKDPKDGDPEELLAWLSRHPAPNSGANGMEVAKQVVAILEQTNRFPNHIADDHPAIERLAGFVPEHLDLLLKARNELAMDQHYSRNALEKAIGRGVGREQVRQGLEELGGVPEAMTKAMNQGWLDELSGEIADMARRGDGSMFFYALRLPDHAGLSDEECLAIFRNNPSPNSYQKLWEVEALRQKLDGEIDAWFEGSLRQVALTGMAVDRPLLLALHRGRPDAPKVLHEVMHRVKAAGGFPYADGVLRSCFEPKDFSEGRGELSKEFLATDPAAFEFDEVERRYRLKKP